MKTGDVIPYTLQALKAIQAEAERTVPFLNPGNRTPEAHLEHTRRGLLGEGLLNYHVGDGAWWVQRRRELRGKRDDGGSDMLDGTNVKTVLPWQERVYVNASDSRAHRFVVICLDELAMTGTILGQFEHADVHGFPDCGRGVFIKELKTIVTCIVAR
jgi:hypothetical protein